MPAAQVRGQERIRPALDMGSSLAYLFELEGSKIMNCETFGETLEYRNFMAMPMRRPSGVGGTLM